ncbi:MAG: hypothetical protein ACRDMH_15480 [Solirubrobacterales bacterium]
MSEAESPTPPPEGQPPQSEEELRARIEEQLRTVRVQDLLLESVVSVLNLTARRIAKEDERDLEQARVGIEAVRAMVGLLDGEQAEQVRSALSQVQVLYAKHAGDGEPDAGEEEATGAEQPPAPERPAPSAAQRAPSKLWTPPGT